MADAESNLSRNHDVLRDLLHFVSQPLTTLHCALEGSLAQGEVECKEDTLLALEQTDQVIEAVRLMREYLEAGQRCSATSPVAIGSAIDTVLQQLSVVAEARGVRLFACGVSKALVPVRDAWLQRALLYLIGTLIESEPAGRAITVLMEDGASQSVISGHSLQPSQKTQSSQHAPSPLGAKGGRDGYLEDARVGNHDSERAADPGSARSALDFSPRCAPVSNVLRQAKIAIAQRAFESSGASVEFYPAEKPGFTIRIPQFASALNQLSA